MKLLKWLTLSVTVAVLISGCADEPTRVSNIQGSPAMSVELSDSNFDPDDPSMRIVKTDEEWRKVLTPEQYDITRNKGTEYRGTGELLHNKRDGMYLCVCCDLPLFGSNAKYESHSGWPSFFQPIDKDHIAQASDHELYVERTEVKCMRCDAHLGHVFEDGPQPTGLRYCINSVALKFDEE